MNRNLVGSIYGKAVSEEKIFRIRPIRNKNCLWWSCLLMDRDEMSILYKGSSIDASYQVSVHLAKRFQKRRFLEIDQSETRIACGGHDKDCSFHPDPFTNMATTGNSCF
jgi:hypothetical protein